ncbi:hypothetical protein B6U74_02430 [Candidatus Bathyarchaeota archaeon ex4484_205]|nr:MAG: hypothetical protein B6U74_02430 [Candidatus Bathyarchaeota archaeon ex4484_205]RLG67657.1 MAG: hypothetical protein DRN93_04110 [archaeon]
MGNKSIYLLDTMVILSGFYRAHNRKFITTSKVRNEVWHRNPSKIDILLVTNQLEILDPEPQYVKKAITHSRTLGEEGKLSDSDISLIALAMQLRDSNKEVIVFTDDYSIQNVLKSLGIVYKPITSLGIRKMFKWKYVCVACKSSFSRKVEICPKCGSKIVRLPEEIKNH